MLMTSFNMEKNLKRHGTKEDKCKESIEKLKSDMADQIRGRSRSIVVITAEIEGVTARHLEVDVFEVAQEIIEKLTKLVIEEGEVKNCQCSWFNVSKILVDFLIIH